MKPSQGIISPNSNISVTITLDTLDIKTLIGKFSQGLHISKDKFLLLEYKDNTDIQGGVKVLDENSLNQFWLNKANQAVSQLVFVPIALFFLFLF